MINTMEISVLTNAFLLCMSLPYIHVQTVGKLKQTETAGQ